MKRMSEVFKLPVNGFELEYLMSKTTEDDDDSIAHAINHVDALADALEVMTSLCYLKYGNSDLDVYAEIVKAKNALNAYRGAK